MSAPEAPAAATYRESRSPRDGRVLAEVEVTPPAALPALVATARKAGKAWAATPMRDRVRALRRIRDRWLAQGPSLARVLMDEGGKSEAEALMSEVVPSVDLFDYWTKAAPEFLAREPVPLSPVNFPGKRGFIEYEPCGVVGLVTPWNYPSSIPVRALVPALLAGNAVVWKPSEHSMLTGRAVYDVFAAELPPGLLVLVQGDGSVGEALVDADVDMVSFTGSAAVGRRIAARTAERLIPVSLELGGKNAALVLDDADLDRASAGVVWGAFANAGQNCAAVSRCYVQRGVAAEFERRVQARLALVKTGETGGELFDVGPVINERQLARMEGHVAGARAAGVEALGGAGKLEAEGHWFAPTVLRSPGKELAVSQEETFGPVLSLHVVDTEDEAVRLANEGDFGLSASVWTKSLKRGEAVAMRLDVGTVTVNNTSFTPVIPNAPWSGRRSSGHGATNSHRALAEMVKPKFVLLDASKGGELWWFPHDAGLRDLARALLGFLDRNLLRKLRALPSVIRLMPARQRRLKRPVS
jgi:acyl-CoA reductase-like NAD-dependent aldehyde dehydrogenase